MLSVLELKVSKKSLTLGLFHVYGKRCRRFLYIKLLHNTGKASSKDLALSRTYLRYYHPSLILVKNKMYMFSGASLFVIRKEWHLLTYAWWNVAKVSVREPVQEKLNHAWKNALIRDASFEHCVLGTSRAVGSLGILPLLKYWRLLRTNPEGASFRTLLLFESRAFSFRFGMYADISETAPAKLLNWCCNPCMALLALSAGRLSTFDYFRDACWLNSLKRIHFSVSSTNLIDAFRRLVVQWTQRN